MAFGPVAATARTDSTRSRVADARSGHPRNHRL